jgi:alpha-1,3-rhamnosyl/mannosyltransferase
VWLERARLAGRSADAVITVSDSSADDVLRLLGPGSRERIHVVPNGIDVAAFRIPTHADVARAKANHEVGDRPYVLFVGNLEPRKNIVALTDAVARLNASGTECDLLVGGSPAWDAEETLRAIEGSPHARRLGFVDEADLPGLMAGSAAFAFPSLYEGFGLPVLEALAVGATVVCSRAGSLAEVAGPHAHFCGPDAESIAEALDAALHRGHPTTPGRASEWARSFTWEASAARHAAVFDRLLES